MKITILPLLLSLLAATHAPAQATLPPEMVFVEGGTFTMGCTPEQQPCFGYESPNRSVKMNSFFIAKTEITGAQYQSLMGFNQGFSSCPIDCPAYVSWYDAVTFCNKLSKMEGLIPCYYANADYSLVFDTLVSDTLAFINCYQNEFANGFRLPWESEWEYTARGGKQPHGFKYAGSNNMDDVGWYDANSGLNIRLVATRKLTC